MQALLNLLKRLLFLTGYVANTSYPKPLSSQEEQQTIREMQQGSKHARDKLICHNMRLVAHIAQKYAHGNTDDLISIGSIGLIKGVESFSAEKGSLATYLARCIENEILMTLRSDKRYKNTVYLQSPLGIDNDGNEYSLMDIIADDNNVFEQAETEILHQNLIKLINTCLEEREKQIILMRYGLTGNAPLTQLQTAKKLGISRSYISRIETHALQKLKLAMQEE